MTARRDRYDSLFQYYGEKHGVDWRRMKAQAMAESALDPNAVSPRAAVGLTQFMPRTWLEWWDETSGIQGAPMSWADRRNPERSIAAQAAYMARLITTFGSWRVALAAYNWGWGRVRSHLQSHDGRLNLFVLPKETRDYIRRVERFHARLLAENAHGA